MKFIRTIPVVALAALVVAGLVASCKGEVKLETALDVQPEPDAGEPPPAEPEGPPLLPPEEAISQATEAAHRPGDDSKRDSDRHPQETLMFFGLRADMTVLELGPGMGWYTDLLAPIVADHGKLIVTNDDPNAPVEEVAAGAKAFEDKLKGNPEVYGQVEIRVIDDMYELGEPETVDMVLTFRNSHIWRRMKLEKRVYKAVFDVLKPGGTFGLVQHRAKPKAQAKFSMVSGYLPEKHVIKAVTGVGFELEESSEINANPRDTKNYRRGVWSLPPVFAYGDKNREKYEAIGESDRMTLRFRKPGGEPEPEPEPEAAAETPDEAATAPATPATPAAEGDDFEDETLEK